MKTLTVTAMLAVAAAALTGCGNVSFGTDEETRSYTAPAGVTALKIETGGSRVEVTASDTSAIKVSERLHWSNDKNKPDARRVTEGDTLTLSAECGGSAIGYTTCGVSYRVQIPRDTPVEIDNNDGSIVASGLGGTVKLHSDHGSVNVSDLRASSASISTDDGPVNVSGRAATADLRSSHGPIAATGLTADRLTARASDGTIRLSGRVKTADLHGTHGDIDANGLAAERVTARTNAGDVRLQFTAPPADARGESRHGDVRVRLPGGHGYAISTSTDHGDTRVDPSVLQDPSSARRIVLDTSNGDVTVAPADQRSW
ncbi:hypothetical protein E1281_14390 [Actinomadura sp. KC345]|uniref:DUF4097 family beta strand repeat-containing protein n=1 Tax=Actinomadura sp. KC345 TaxID=2530371 RepID=UPI00104AC4F9|nr:DUF4097 family beta strand repeat-containing protein [Actinomadura sp. KC345]TDC55069.1 hypothetical protein E1281_14390 [Actinomadura sp. KC345]